MNILQEEKGAIAVTAAIILTMLVSCVALAIDIGHLVYTKNELQNAADAGALSGANNLYNDTGTVIQATLCNQRAEETAKNNLSEKTAVEVNDGDIQRGHWSWGLGTLSRGFTANDATAVVPLWDADGKTVATVDLDQDPDFINAVQVTVRREATPIASFFATIFGIDNFTQSATAVAYVGFAGDIGDGEIDIPVALCEEFIETGSGGYACGQPVMYENGETAMWTNLLQSDPPNPDSCPTTYTGAITDAISDGNSGTLALGGALGVLNGINDAAFKALHDKWVPISTTADGDRRAISATFPVVSCIDDVSGLEENTCAVLTHAVEVKVLWLNDQENVKAAAKDTPNEYYDYHVDDEGNEVIDDSPSFSSSETNDIKRWYDFCLAIGLTYKDEDGNEILGKYDEDKFSKNQDYIPELDGDGNPVEYSEADGGVPLALPIAKKQIYFEASCGIADPVGGANGENYGTLAARAVLVE